MLTEASRGGHLTVANLLLKQPRMLQHSSTVRGTKFTVGRKSHVRNPHHQYAAGAKSQKASSNSSVTTGQSNSAHVSATQDSGNSRTQRKTQAVNEGGGARAEGGAVQVKGGDTVGSTKRQKLSDESNAPPFKPQVSNTSGTEGDQTVPPRNIPRVGPAGSNPTNSSPSHGAEASSSTTTTITAADPTHPQGPARPSPPTGAHLTTEDVLMRCMLQMAQAQTLNSAPTSAPSTAAHSNNTPSASTTSTSPSTTQRPVTKQGKGPESPNSMFSRGNFASLDHLSSSLSSQPTSSSSQPHPPPKCHTTRGKSTTSAALMSSNTTTSLCSAQTQSSPSATFSNADISRLIPHLEAIASSLQNTPSLESHCLAALAAQSHLLPALAQYDPDAPQASELLDTLQNIPLVTSDGKQIPLSNTATIDPASFLASLDMSALLQNLTSPELQGSDPSSDGHSQPLYPADFKRLSQKMQSTGVVQSSSDQAAEGEFEGELHQTRPRPLTTSFLLDHNFPMDIPPPTDLLPEHVSVNCLVQTVECHDVHVDQERVIST